MKSLKAFKRIIEKYGRTNSLEGTYADFLIIKKDLDNYEKLKTIAKECIDLLQKSGIGSKQIALEKLERFFENEND